MAIDTPNGLLVPNIKNVQALSVFEVAQELTRLVDLGQAAKLGPTDLSGGTFSLSNIGAVSQMFTPYLIISDSSCPNTLMRERYMCF